MSVANEKSYQISLAKQAICPFVRQKDQKRGVDVAE